MHKTHYVNGNLFEQYLYKTYANTFNKVKRLAKKNYYHNQLQTATNNQKKHGIFYALFYLPNQCLQCRKN